MQVTLVCNGMALRSECRRVWTLHAVPMSPMSRWSAWSAHSWICMQPWFPGRTEGSGLMRMKAGCAAQSLQLGAVAVPAVPERAARDRPSRRALGGWAEAQQGTSHREWSGPARRRLSRQSPAAAAPCGTPRAISRTAPVAASRRRCRNERAGPVECRWWPHSMRGRQRTGCLVARGPRIWASGWRSTVMPVTAT